MIITRLLFKCEHDDYHPTIVQMWRWWLSRDYCSNLNITRLLFKCEHDDYHVTIVQIWTSHDYCSPLWTGLLFTTVNTTIVTASWTTDHSNHSHQYTHVLHYITCIRRFNTNFHDSSTPINLLRKQQYAPGGGGTWYLGGYIWSIWGLANPPIHLPKFSAQTHPSTKFFANFCSWTHPSTKT